MLQTQHLYSHQQQYNQHEQSAWQHNGPQQSHAPLSHGQHQAQSQLAAAQHYSRLAVNPNHNSHAQSTNRQVVADNAQSSLGASLTAMNEQASPGMDQQLSEENRKVLQWVAELLDPNRREGALMELSKKREQVPELALVLWHSFGVMTSLLQEIISVYPLLNPSQLTAAASNRVCNALALLQCVASHNETRGLFLNAHIPLFLYPFLNTTSKSRPFEYLRLTSLGVIGALVKNEPSSNVSINPSGTPGAQANAGNSSPTITFLLTTEIIPLCLRIMETGSELSKTVAIFIVQKILLDDTGLGYICATYERFYAVGTVLSNMVIGLVETQTVRLLKHVVRCFLRLSDNNRARQALRQCLPEPLRDATFSNVLRDDAATKRCLAQLLINLSDTVADAQNDQFE
ncbi:Cell differentiation protein rcd1 [Cladophialophora carrionii]|uniref:Cell differentiation protein rcd1 n=1 Tax=Cladophialophora carrionii TaxID=86049 RepID=A0A1C1CTI1_9EURO|nr:Cell differentiation protein rcd1 [Cladophialophora carrionii]